MLQRQRVILYQRILYSKIEIKVSKEHTKNSTSFFLFVCLFVCLFVQGFRPTGEFFTHKESSPLPVKGCKL